MINSGNKSLDVMLWRQSPPTFPPGLPHPNLKTSSSLLSRPPVLAVLTSPTRPQCAKFHVQTASCTAYWVD